MNIYVRIIVFETHNVKLTYRPPDFQGCAGLHVKPHSFSG